MGSYFGAIAADQASSPKQDEFRAPRRDEVEITVLGPGTGESIVVHVGNGAWLIIDSFALPKMPVPGGDNDVDLPPAPVQYLTELGVDLTEQVHGVAITHPHADHYGGIEDVVELCTPEQGDGPDLYFPAVLNSETWGQVFRAGEKSRLIKLGEALTDAREDGRLQFIIAGSVLPPPYQDVLALAPLGEGLLVEPVDGKKTLQHVNYSSIVFWVAVGASRALLAGDLDEHDNYGWSGIKTTFKARIRSGEIGHASYVKIPHHGSKRANWMKQADPLEFLRVNEPQAVVTRNLNGQPSDKDVDREPATGRRPPLPHPTVAQHHPLRDSMYLIGSSQASNAQVGWVTARHPIDGSGHWDLSHFGQVRQGLPAPAAA